MKGPFMFEAQAIRVAGPDAAAFTDIYKHQFQISVDGAVIPPGWQRTRIGAVDLDTAPDLVLTRLEAPDGQLVGMVMGLAVDAAGGLLRDNRVIGPPAIEQAEAFVESLAGRYAAVLAIGSDRRLYLDPVGDLAAVYNPEARIAASTTLFALDRDFIDNPVIPFHKVRTGAMNYSLGHTRDAHVERLYANHYLDLTDFRPVRHWPKPGTDLATRSKADVPAIMDEITARLRAVFVEILKTQTCIVPLSGGRDSRSLLACGLPAIHCAKTLFAWEFHRASAQDARLGRQIAESLNLPYVIYPKKKLTRAAKMLYLRRNGYSIFSDALKSIPISETMPCGMVMTRGNVIGILRATNWYGQNEGDLRIGHVFRRLGMKPVNAPDTVPRKAFKDQFLQWYETLPEQGRAKVYDMLWLDIVLTHGQGTRSYGMPNNFVVNPFNDRRLLQLSMQLPLSLRRTDRGYDMIIDRTAPALHKFPYH